MDYRNIIRRIACVSNSIRQNEDAILEILVETESYKTAKSEIDKALFCLDNIEKQILYIRDSTLSELCVFLPMNQPLYSLALFVIIPGCMFKTVFCRPPVLLNRTYTELFKILGLSNYSVSILAVSRREFIDNNAKSANAVIYTGKYENAVGVLQKLPQQTIFIFQGSAANPIIITPSANISVEMVSKVVESQIYNSGQDCMAPASIFVSSNNWNSFVERLKIAVKKLRIGRYSDTKVDIAPLLERETVRDILSLFRQHKTSILFGGTVDEVRTRIQKRLRSVAI